MLLSNVEDIIHTRTVESSRVEYKKDWNPERIMHTICAFANDIDNIGGGYVIVGVEESNGMPIFPISGINKESIDEINKELLGICNLIEPRYIPTVEHSTVDGKDILVIEAIVGQNRPYKCPDRLSKKKSEHSGKSYYIRKLSNTIVANIDDEHSLFEVSADTPYDCRVNPYADIKDIRPSLIYEYMSKVDRKDYEATVSMPLEIVMKNLKIVGLPPNDSKPINAGILFFNEKPENYIEGARIEMVTMPEPTGDGMVETKFNGPLDLQLEGAISYIGSQVIKTRTIKKKDTPIADKAYNYPLTAIEEILSNAVYHKDYSIGEPVTVTIRPDRISVLSIPGPDRSITDEDLKTFQMASTRYRNARIGDLLKHRRLAEKRGSGIPSVLASLRDNGSPPPLFETDEGRTFFRATIFIHNSFLENNGSVERSLKRSSEDLRNEILSALRDHGALSMRELADILGYSRNARNMYETVRTLVNDGIVEYTIPDKISSRNQRIRLRI